MIDNAATTPSRGGLREGWPWLRRCIRQGSIPYCALSVWLLPAVPICLHPHMRHSAGGEVIIPSFQVDLRKSQELGIFARTFPYRTGDTVTGRAGNTEISSQSGLTAPIFCCRLSGVVAQLWHLDRGSSGFSKGEAKASFGGKQGPLQVFMVWIMMPFRCRIDAGLSRQVVWAHVSTMTTLTLTLGWHTLPDSRD